MARANRRPMTEAETALWQKIRSAQVDNWKFRRQHPVGRFIADFYCAEARLIVELDGRSHDATVNYDAERTEWLSREGYTVIRFANDDVLKDSDSVIAVIVRHCRDKADRHKQS
jgi:very-short-patch-repair endonuclease